MTDFCAQRSVFHCLEKVTVNYKHLYIFVVNEVWKEKRGINAAWFLLDELYPLSVACICLLWRYLYEQLNFFIWYFFFGKRKRERKMSRNINIYINIYICIYILV